jgi:hypothetical protein
MPGYTGPISADGGGRDLHGKSSSETILETDPAESFEGQIDRDPGGRRTNEWGPVSARGLLLGKIGQPGDPRVAVQLLADSMC